MNDFATDINVGGTDMISRKAAIEALYSQREKSGNIWVRTAITNCVEAIEQLPPAEPEKRTEERTETHACDSISRQAAIDGKICIQRANGVEIYDDYAVPVEYLKRLPPAQLAPDQNGDLWINVPDIDKVTCIYVQESKSKFCRIFYEERI